MTAHDGILCPGSIVSEERGTLIAEAVRDPFNIFLPVFPENLEEVEYLSPGTLVGTRIKTCPITNTCARQWTGLNRHAMPSFGNDVWYRFYLIPNIYNLFILTELTRDITLWNAWLQDVTCTDIDITQADELTLDIPTGEPPFDLVRWMWRLFSVTIPFEGEVVFTSLITFDFGAFGSPIMTIIGTRAMVYGWWPLVGMEESLEWGTDVIPGRDGTEQRHSYRPVPRQSFQIETYFEDEQDQAQFDMRAFYWHKRLWGVPLWIEYEEHAATINVDDTTINVDTRYAEFHDDSLAIIWQGSDSYEVIQVETVSDSQLTLLSGVKAQWTGDKYIMPLRIAAMSSQIERPAAPDGFGHVRCGFLVKDNRAVTGFTASQTYQGLTVIGKSTIVEEEQEVNQDADYVQVDYGLAEIDVISDSDFNITVQSHIIRRDGKEDCWDFRQWLHSTYGRQVPFWVPTDRVDIVQRQAIGSGETNLKVNNIGLKDLMDVNAMRTHIALIFPDGTIICREVETMTVVDANEEDLFIDSALGITVNPGDCEICWLDKCRLTSDQVQITWEEPFSLICQMQLTRVSQ